MDQDIVDLHLSILFPIKAPDELRCLEIVPEKDGRLHTIRNRCVYAVVRLVIWSRNDSTAITSLDDVIEQEVRVLDESDLTDQERLFEYLHGLSTVLRSVLSNRRPPGMYPADLFELRSKVLMLKTAKASDDFVRALSVKTRLGKYL